MKFVRESFIVFRRQVRMNLRNPAWVLIGVMQPVLYLLLFGPLLKPLVDDFGVDNPYTFLVPGLLVQLACSARSSPASGLSGSGAKAWSRGSGSLRPAARRCWWAG